MSPPRHVIPRGQEELLRRVLNPPEGLPDGWELVRASIGADSVDARYRHGDEAVSVHLVHRDAASERDVRTESFAFDATSLPAELARAVEVSLIAREHRVVWTEVDEVDPSWCALEAGVARVFRSRPELADRYRERGAAVVQLESILYVARDAGDAERAREVEAPLLSDELAWDERRERTEELGWLLGHPSCCVDARVRRLHPGTLELALSFVSGRVGSETYRAARDAWVPRPRARLAPSSPLIGFEPCRYDCRAALELADRVAARCAEVDPAWMAETDAALASPIVIAPSGAIAHVSLERRIEPLRIVRAQSDDEELARRLIGAEARDDGLLMGRGVRWCLLVDFS